MSLTLDEIKTEVARMDPGLDPFSDAFRAAVILLSSACAVGPNVKRLAKFIGYRRSEIAPVARRLRENGVWRGGKVVAEWFEKHNGGAAFWLDVNVALGLMKRVNDG